MTRLVCLAPDKRTNGTNGMGKEAQLTLVDRLLGVQRTYLQAQ